MNVARILYPVEVLGPGRRIGIWVCGCRRGCKGCSNPELWERKSKYEITVDEVIKLIDRVAGTNRIDGFTISGGEPLDQAEGLDELVTGLKDYSEDILVYSGYTIEQLRDMKNRYVDSILDSIAVLIDGAYIEEENKDVLLRGSANQRIHILNPELDGKYMKYLETAHNQIQNFTTSDGVVSVGIHRKGFNS